VTTVKGIRRGPGARAAGRAGRRGILGIVTELAVHIAVQDTAAGPRTVVELVGQADVSAQAMSEALAAEAAKAPQLLILDLSRLSFIDSSALGAIIRTHRALRGNGGKLALVNPSPSVARILQLVDIAHTIPVYPSVEDAAAG
jgi:anti-anti-sigma factor